MQFSSEWNVERLQLKTRTLYYCQSYYYRTLLKQFWFAEAQPITKSFKVIVPYEKRENWMIDTMLYFIVIIPCG